MHRCRPHSSLFPTPLPHLHPPVFLTLGRPLYSPPCALPALNFTPPPPPPHRSPSKPTQPTPSHQTPPPFKIDPHTTSLIFPTAQTPPPNHPHTYSPYFSIQTPRCARGFQQDLATQPPYSDSTLLHRAHVRTPTVPDPPISLICFLLNSTCL